MTTSPRQANRIRILSYNIRHGEGMDGQIDLARIARVIRSAAPDVVALQEIDRRIRRTGYADQAAELARLTGMQVAFGRAMRFEGEGQYGNAILSRWPIVHTETHSLPGALESRGVLRAQIELPTGHNGPQSLSLLVTHLALDEESRLQSVHDIASIVSGSATPALFAGDFNAKPDSAVVEALCGTWRSTTRGQDLVTFTPTPSQIDYILYRPQTRWHVASTEVIDERIASDHCPILAVLDLLAPTQNQDTDRQR